MSKSKNSESIKVVVRCRPMNKKELTANFESVVSVDVKLGQIIVRNPKDVSATELLRVFTFDSVYDWTSTQLDLYNETFRPLVDSVLHGFNGTIFAYGQTGTGKTYTMEGDRRDPERRGVIPNSFDHIFTHISRSQNQQYLVSTSYLEIYQNEIRDLLSQDQTCRLQLREKPDTGVYVKGLSSFVSKSAQEIGDIMNVGNKNRSVGATNMNEHSSRSHAIFVIKVECSELGLDGENHIRVGKLNLVDLAGSERQKKTGAQGKRLKEATKINLSLSALGNVISALVDGKSSHIPYRDSKLTHLLQDSLGGNARTVMVANIGPASYNVEETLMTLQYSNRAKNIKNKPQINEDPKDALLRKVQKEIAELKAQLLKRSGKTKKSRQRKRVGERTGGEDLEGETEDDGEDGDDEGDYWREQQEKLERERKAIMEDHSLVEEEKFWLLKEKEKKMEELKREMEIGEKLAKKVKEIESRLLVGGDSIVDHTNKQQKMLQQKQQEIAEQTRREHEMQQQVENHDEETVELKETYSSLQQEVDFKTKKLKKLFGKLQELKEEILNIHDAHIEERQELEQLQNDLTKDLKLKRLIIKNFIPLEEKEKITNRAYFDKEDECWKMKPITCVNDHDRTARPLSTIGYRRPLCNFARQAMMMRPDIRYKADNTLMLELDMPTRNTKDYQPRSMNPIMAAALELALKDDVDVEIDASDFDSSSVLTTPASSSNSLKRPKSGRPKTGRKLSTPTSGQGSPIYPKPRGLVPR